MVMHSSQKSKSKEEKGGRIEDIKQLEYIREKKKERKGTPAAEMALRSIYLSVKRTGNIQHLG
jgi:hypothetical protein